MNLENTKLRTKCPSCGKSIILTFHTRRCPKCFLVFKEDYVKRIFYDYESNVANSAFTKVGEKMTSAGEGMEKTGNTIQQIGCIIMLIPIVYILFQLISAFN
ncbi:hypothetical protein ACTQNA_07940 [Streptococcus pyogenes]